MIEAEVHEQLKAFLRAQRQLTWPHHLSLARLVARALRVGRHTLVQISPGSDSNYRLSWLMPLLLWPGPVVLVASTHLQHRLLHIDLPRLRQWLNWEKPLLCQAQPPTPDFQGVWLTTVEDWLQADAKRIGQAVVFAEAEGLEAAMRQHLTHTLGPADWHRLRLACPSHADIIRDVQVGLTQQLFQHPANPFDAFVLEAPSLALLQELLETLPTLPLAWAPFLGNGSSAHGIWAELNRSQGQFQLHCSPASLACFLQPYWTTGPLVLIGEALDANPQAEGFRCRLGLPGELTCVSFGPDRQREVINLYAPAAQLLPNTPGFLAGLLTELRRLLSLQATAAGVAVILVEDMPLKQTISAQLAAEFGSRVQLERTGLEDNGILVSSVDYWLKHQAVLPAPQVLVVATLPFPPLEDPRVALQVAHFKQNRQDWFRLYLLPEAITRLQGAIAPLRANQGLLCIVDGRLLRRSYGAQFLQALEPCNHQRYLSVDLFLNPDA
jgi:ATP-dependent DNA helicase DinG